MCMYTLQLFASAERGACPIFFSAIIHRRVSPSCSITLPSIAVLKGKNNILYVYVIMMHIILFKSLKKQNYSCMIETRDTIIYIMCAVYIGRSTIVAHSRCKVVNCDRQTTKWHPKCVRNLFFNINIHFLNSFFFKDRY